MTATEDGPLQPAEPVPYRLGARQLAQAVLGLGLAMGLVVWGLPYFAETSWEEVFEALGRVGPGTSVLLFLLMTAGLWLYTFTLTGSLPGLSHPRALIINVCGSSLGNLLPGGGAVGAAATYAICRTWGFTRRDISTSLIVTAVWNILARLMLPVAGIGALLSNAEELPAGVVRGAAVGAVIAVLLVGAFISGLASERAGSLIGRTVDRVVQPFRRSTGTHTLSVDELIGDLRARVSAVVRRGWHALTLGLVGYFGMWFALFWLCLHAMGVSLELSHLFAAYTIGRLLTTVGVTPGGLGLTESGTAAVLVAWGVDGTAAAAGVVLFAIYTHLLEIPLGALGWLAWGLSTKQRPPDAHVRHGVSEPDA